MEKLTPLYQLKPGNLVYVPCVDGKTRLGVVCEGNKISIEPDTVISKTAQLIIDARANHPNMSLAEMYDDAWMPADLRRAHELNDRAVMEAYGFDPAMKESEIVSRLMQEYKSLCEGSVSHE